MTSFSSNLEGRVSKALKSLDGRTACGFSGFLVRCRTPECSHWALLVQLTFAFFPPPLLLPLKCSLSTFPCSCNHAGYIFDLEVDWSWEVLLTPQMASNTTLVQSMQLLDKPCCKAELELLLWWQSLRHRGKRSVLLTSAAATGQAEAKAWSDEGRSVLLQTVSSCVCSWV